MRLSLACAVRRPLVLASSAAAIFALTATVGSAQILQTHGESLTTYLPSVTAVQNVRPRPEQRGTNLEGSMRKGSPLPFAIAGNPFEDAWRGEMEIDGVGLDVGAWSPSEVDISLPAPGFRWTLGRSFGSRQDSSGHHASNGYQGFNWHQSSQPEIVFHDDATGPEEDLIYLVYGADRFAEFKRTGSGTSDFKGVNGAAGVFVHSTGSPDTFALTDQRGLVYTFFGFNTADADHKGQLWKIVDPAGNTAYVGSTSSASAAISAGYDADGRITLAYDSASRSYAYTYSSSTIGGVKRLETVVVTASSVEVARVAYSYYPDSPSSDFGEPGDLRTATVTLPLTDSGINDIRVQHYRYWEGAYDPDTNPGHTHAIKLVVNAEGARRYEFLDSTFDDDLLAETTANLLPYASAHFEYDSSRRIVEGSFNGDCGCGGAGSGTFALRYESNGAHPAGSSYDEEWLRRTSVERPDGSWLTQYFDEVGQSMSHVITAGDPSSSPGSTWVTAVERDTIGCVVKVGTPAAVATYTHDDITPAPDGSITLEASTGLIRRFLRSTSTDNKGYVTAVKFKEGNSGADNTWYYERTLSYDFFTKTVGAATLARPRMGDDGQYETPQTILDVDEELRSLNDSVARSNPNELSIETGTLTVEAVSAANNGENAANSSSAHYALDGSLDYEKTRDGTITYREYTNGQLTKEIDDASTASLTEPTGFTHSGTPLHLVTDHAYDAQGRRTTTTLPSGRVTQSYHTILKDRRRVTLEFPKYDSGTGKRYGPVHYTVTNHAGKVETSGVIALTGNESTSALTGYIDETDANAISAVDVGAVAQLRVSIFDDTGTQLTEERAYFSIPSSLPGTDGTHYDATLHGYDEMGRRRRTKEAHGTITRSVFDTRGQTIERWVGTNDNGLAGGESSGTANMVKVEELEYDGGAAGGNGHVTKRTAFIQDSATGKRETTYYFDPRGRVIATVNPTAPHTVTAYDNLGRATASAQYSSSSGLSASSAPTTTANRLAYSVTVYDERGQVWKSIRHNITASTGVSADTLETLSWFDGAGRLKKRDGEQLEKFAYGRLGRQTHHFVLAAVDAAEDTWIEAMDLTEDIVLEERQTTFADEGEVLMEATISRLYDDAGTGENIGALDRSDFTTAEEGYEGDHDPLEYTAADVVGRIQITARWYDAFDRLVDVVQYGTNDATANVGTFDRDGLSVPARADDKLRTTYEFNTDGTLKQTTDPKGLITRVEYDALGRQTAVIANYVDGTAGGGGNGDEDQIVRYAYTDGLQVSITADLPGGETDQVTTYTFGTTKGASAGDSKIATGHLLQKVTYPDSANSDDVVRFAFNAQGQEIWKKDQAGGIIETTYDDAGRSTVRAVTTLASGFDGAVRRIETAYDSLGRTETVTQYDAASSGSVIDQVKNLYDGWGNLTNFRQDLDSAVGGSGYWDVAYTYAKATSGRNTVRRTGVTLPGGAAYGFNYRGGASHDTEASRVSSVTDAFATDLADYEYNGAEHVVRTTLNEVEIFSKAYTGAGTTFGRLDRFNRTTISSWTKDLSTDSDIYKVTLGYDRNSNITVQDDAVHTGHDVAYLNDNLNRLIDAEEGTWGGSSISSRTRHQIWTLNQTGNWELDKLDLDGDDNFNETGELNDDRTHNVVNELVGRDTDDSGSDNYTLVYDTAGNMTDDGAAYTYEWDAFYRLRKVRNRSNSALVSEYWYNGLGYLVTRHQDTDTDGDVDGSDVKFHTAYDERWRQVATFRGSDANPKEQFVYHCAGDGGYGDSAYIDSVLLRDRDMTNGWTSSADGTLEKRTYYLQNWRADVVALVEPDGDGGAVMVEWLKYSAYGVPFALPAGDTDSDGDCDSTDDAQVTTWKNAPAYDVRGDLNLDGVIDADDETLVAGAHQSLGRGVLTSNDVGNRKGYAGYEGDAKLSAKWHVRHRVLDSVLGRWLTQDPLEYVDSTNPQQYSRSQPIGRVDPTGAESSHAGDGKPPFLEPPSQSLCSGDCITYGERNCTFQRLELELVGRDCGLIRAAVWLLGAESVVCSNLPWPVCPARKPCVGPTNVGIPLCGCVPLAWRTSGPFPLTTFGITAQIPVSPGCTAKVKMVGSATCRWHEGVCRL
jgi:RHS repeat-associated protein